MKILNFEDNVYKHLDIKKAIEMAGRHEMAWVGSVEEGMAELGKAGREGHPYDLIITDMHFPVYIGGESDLRAGYRVLEEVQKRGLSIPVIVCSSMNIRPAGCCGSVWYSPISDWDMELVQLIQNMRK